MWGTPSKQSRGIEPGSFVHGIFQAKVLEWGAIAFSELFSLAKPKCDHWYIATTHTLFDLFFP